MSATTPAVVARDLTYAYRDRRALDGVGFEIARGEVAGFLGPNGGGKSTLFKLLSTLERPATGELSVLGHRLPGAADLVRRKLGVVFQSPSLDGELTVAENLACHGRLHGLSRRRIARRRDELLERFGLAERADDRVKTLSGGLQRRVELAKALLPSPELLLLDEPSTGLDPGARRDLGTLLRELAADDGVTVLLTTHVLEEAERCDHLALLSRGRIVARGTPAELIRRVGGDVVQLATGQPEALARDIEQVAARWNGGQVLGAQVRGGTVRFEHPHGPALLARLAEAFPGRIDSMSVSRPTLEDVFLDLTGQRLSDDQSPVRSGAGS